MPLEFNLGWFSTTTESAWYGYSIDFDLLVGIGRISVDFSEGLRG